MDKSEVREQLERILAGAVFSRSQRICRMLRFIVEHALEHVPAELKEYTIGVAVFDRSPEFDPRLDPIVRVEARRLRNKLREYYDTEGIDDPVLIQLPKGAYLPAWQKRKAPPAELVPPSARQYGRDAWSLAVLPFLNLSGDPGRDYFTDGLTEEITSELARIRELQVVARTSSFYYRSRTADIRDIGRNLNVRLLLQGSVRWAEHGLRISVQLVDAIDGFYVWSESFEVEEKHLVAVQREIAGYILKTLRVRIPEEGAPQQEASQAERFIDAHHAYLRGRFLWNRAREEDVREAIKCFEQAIQMDPDYADAHAGVAESCCFLAMEGASPPKFEMERARQMAERGLQLNPGSAEAHAALALVGGVYDFKLRESRRKLVLATELKPSFAMAYNFLGTIACALCEKENTLRWTLKAIRLDPLSLATNLGLLSAYTSLGEFAKASQQADRTMKLAPDFYKAHLQVALLHAAQGKHDRAIDSIEHARTLAGDHPFVLANLGFCHGIAGRKPAAADLAGVLSELAQRRYVDPALLALPQISIGDYDAALDHLEEAYRQRSSQLIQLRADFRFRCLEGIPRFEALCKKVGLESRCQPNQKLHVPYRSQRFYSRN